MTQLPSPVHSSVQLLQHQAVPHHLRLRPASQLLQLHSERNGEALSSSMAVMARSTIAAGKMTSRGV